jgi:hypothetical protein
LIDEETEAQSSRYSNPSETTHLVPVKITKIAETTSEISSVANRSHYQTEKTTHFPWGNLENNEKFSEFPKLR